MPSLSPETLEDFGVYAGGLSIAEMDSRTHAKHGKTYTDRHK